ncbi:MAG: winged helix DNA-binding domain-containing protein [Propionibacteriaceae bacterium]|jgi:uncharacterized protein YcaQ|nr:winged helix DNA-binding domain-containing protein [Propionibacteriaceae bacterium]
MIISIGQARRMILAAQGLGGDRDREVGIRQVQAVIDRVGQFQIDAVNVLVRAHLMPLFTRLGPYDPSLLTRASQTAPRRLFEGWGHAASFIDINLYPQLQFRRDEAYAGAWSGMRKFYDEHQAVIDQMAEVVAERGPATARDLDPGEDRRRDHWGWNWGTTKAALEWLFLDGRVAVAGRNAQFERIYDLPERVIPAAQLAACQPLTAARPHERAELIHQAHGALVARAARALGLGTTRCYADYFRTALAPTRAAIADLARQGLLIEAEVTGVKEPTWIWHDTPRPRKIETAALVSPFDSLVFERERLAKFFKVDYKISIYTPAAQRTHGYYVYLFVLDDQVVARTDLKADRANSRLLVQSAWLEPTAATQRARVTTELTTELHRLATWLGLAEITASGKGDLSRDLL